MSDTHRVLIVEDNALVAKFYRMALERAGGFSCLLTEDANAMFPDVEAGRIDCAIVDVSLTATEWKGQPVDGIELTRLLKEWAPRRFPILIATAHAMAGDRERLLQTSGADDYLEKPVYDAEMLVGKIRKLLNSK